MRLTLRTLLAWMDGVLPAESAGQLAEKVAGSAVAQTLANRIRDVATRPAIAAAPPEGRGLAADPNAAAEFLDNVLPAERLAAFERVCIESDMQLAEVADCHRLLADLTAGRAVVGGIDASLAERLRAIALSERAAPAAPPTGRAPLDSGAMLPEGSFADTVFVSPASGDRAIMPAASAGTVTRAWLLAGSAAAVLICLLGVLGWSLAGGGRREVAVRVPAAVAPPLVGESLPEEPANPAAGAEAPAVAGAPPAVTVDGPPVESAAPAAPSPADAPSIAVPESSPDPERAAASSAEQPPATGPPPMAIAPRVPQGEALAIAAAPTPAVPVVPQPTPEQPASPPAAGETPPAVVAGPFVLLVGAGAAPQQSLVWQARAAAAEIPLPAELVSPPFSQPELVVGRLRIRFGPGTRAAVMPDADGTVRLEVLFGRAIVVAEDPGARLGISAAGLVGRVGDGLEASLGVEVALDREPGSDPAVVAATRRARLVSAGDIEWEQTAEDGGPPQQLLRGFDPAGRVPAGTLVEWSSANADTAMATRVAALPGWVAGSADIEAAERQAAVALASRLPADGPVQPALERLAADPRGEQRVLAAATLALLGDYAEAVRQLSAEDRGRELYAGQWSKLESLTVPPALARGANAAARLAKAFADHAPAGTAESLTRLALGFSPTDLAAGADAWLVDALEDRHLVVRRYAFQRLTELVNPAAVDRLRYRPDGRPEQRREGVEWWRRQQEEGRLRGVAPAPR
ncbi:MAG: hypothetical protein ACKOOF_00730 [Planctomycetaceae bacterium]